MIKYYVLLFILLNPSSRVKESRYRRAETGAINNKRRGKRENLRLSPLPPFFSAPFSVRQLCDSLPQIVEFKKKVETACSVT